MGKLSRRKGVAFEREIARRLTVATRQPFERNLSESRTGNAGDIWDRTGRCPLIVQTKCGKAPSVWQAVKEAQEAAEDTGLFAVAIVRRNATSSHEKPEDLAVMPLEDFEELLSQLRASGAW